MPHPNATATRPARCCVAMLAVVTACGPEEGITFEGVVQQHREETGSDYTDCGTIRADSACSQEADSARSCLMDAFSRCEPAELTTIYYGIDSGPFTTVLFVDPRDQGCHVIDFTDHSRDVYKGDYGDFIASQCSGVHLVETGGGCSQLAGDGCSQVDEWYE